MPRPEVRGDQLSRITVGMVRLHRDFYGRGPTQAKTHAVNDTLICILKNGFTTVEETLLAAGDEEEVAGLRRRFQQRMEDQFVAVVEEATDRKVRSYLSQISPSDRVSVEIFLLEPEGSTGQTEDAAEFDEFDESGDQVE